jgi:hypothetical protein
MSCVGLSFLSRPLPVGAFINLVIDWPIRYGGIFPIELHAAGRVQRNEGGRTAVALTLREFKVLETGDAVMAAGTVV